MLGAHPAPRTGQSSGASGPLGGRAGPRRRRWPTSPPREPSTATVALLDPPLAQVRPSSVPRTYSGPCADERRLADERCELATRSQAQADEAADALRRAQRAYDTPHQGRRGSRRCRAPADHPDLKEHAQREFRAASRAATGPDAVEDAARTWLQEINRINRDAAGAQLAADRERELADGDRRDARATGPGGRRGADRRGDGAGGVRRCPDRRCGLRRTGRDRRAGRRLAGRAQAPEPVAIDDNAGARRSGRRSTAEPRHGSSGCCAAIRRRDGRPRGEPRRRRCRGAATLAGRHPALVDAILADAIEQAASCASRMSTCSGARTPWSRTATSPGRSPRSAIARTGSGAGSTTGSRSQRELSLSLGYAGLDPMRMRQWPNEVQTAQLFRDVAGRRGRVPRRGRRRPDPRRDGRDARTPGRRPGRPVEQLGPDPAAAARGSLTGQRRSALLPRCASPVPRPRRRR